MARRSSLKSSGSASVSKIPPASDQAPALWASSYEELGEIFGLHRASFPRLVKRLKAVGIEAPTPRANGDHDVQGWKQFFEEHPEIKRQAAEGTKSALEEAIQEEKLRAIRFDNDLKDGLYLRRAEVEAWLIERVQQLQDRLRSKFRNELPPKLAGLSAADIAAKMDPIVADLCAVLRGKLPPAGKGR